MGNVCCTEDNPHVVNADNAERRSELPFPANFRQGSFKDRVYGAILGSLLGNAYGAYSVGSNGPLSHEDMFQIMAMPGGGYHGTGPGQLAHDGELTMCLLRALVDGNKVQ